MDNVKFLKAINDSFVAYNKKGGARSNKKLIPIHKFISESILSKLNKNYSVKSLGIGDGKEATIEGKYYPKDLDIAIFKNDKIVATISFKFVTSNIRRQNIGFAHFLVLRGHTPYYLKNKNNLRGKQKGTEIISEKNLQKYIKLFKDMDFPHKPDLIGICILDFDKNKKAKFVDLDSFDFLDETKRLLKEDFSLNNFLDKFIHLINLKS